MRSRSMLPALVSLGLLAGCHNTTGGALIALPFQVAGVQRDATQAFTFITPKGWTVTLDQARLAVGPFYFNVSPPPTDSFRGGVVILQGTAQTIVDPLDPRLKEFPGGADGETGQAISVEVDLLPPDGTECSADQALLETSQGFVAGTATRGGVTVPFQGRATIDSSLVTPQQPLAYLQRVAGAVTNLNLTSQPQRVVLRVDPTHWFDSTDFDTLLPGDGGTAAPPYGWAVQSTFNTQLLQGIKAFTGVYDFSLEDAGPPDIAAGVCGADAGPPGDAGPLNVTFDAGFTQTAPNTPGSIGVTFSGETLGINGLPYTPVTQGDPYFVDGWTVTIQEYLIVLGNIRLNATPLMSAVNWPEMGATVATKAGPYVVDAHRAAGFIGKDGVEPASGIFAWQRQDDGSSFDTGVRYAFSYDVVPASYPATQVNLLTSEFSDYDRMVQNGWSKFIRFTATHVGQGTYANPNDPDSAAKQALFAQLPSVVNLTFGWNDATSNLNCVNPELCPANSQNCDGDLGGRGVKASNAGMTLAQITAHIDHVFWDTLILEGAPLRFDPIAAFAPLDTRVVPFDLNGFHGQHIATTFGDAVRTPLPDRGPTTTGNGIPFTTDQGNNGVQVILNTNGVTSVPDDAVDFMAFSAQSQMHLNAQGLCWVVGQHPSDPYYVPNVKPAQ
jgi:hypothetical protein